MQRTEDKHMEAVPLLPPTPSSLHEGSSSGLPQKGLGEGKTKQPNQPKTHQKINHTLKGKCQAPFPRAEPHQQVVVGQSCSVSVLAYPQPW